MTDQLSHIPEIEQISGMIARADKDSPIQIHLVKLLQGLKNSELRRSLIVSDVLSKASLRSAARAAAELLIRTMKNAGIEGSQRQAVAEKFWAGFAQIVDQTTNSTEPATARLRGPVR
jgi:hypothetical protein